VTASAFCASRTPINTHLTAEGYALLADPVFVPYACMGTDALADLVASHLRTACCALMQNHGVITVAETLLAAFDRLELLEVAARHTLIARQLDDVSELSREQCTELDRLMGRDQ
jgi:L-fuculose-phosphate aldolase